MEEPIIVALDFANAQETEFFLQKLTNKDVFVKVGMELFYKEGASFVEHLKALHFKIFLDLKLHDIPTTVKKAMKNIATLNVDMVNVHAAGGTAMMEAAKEGLYAGTAAGEKSPLLIAVTQLTSMTEAVMKNELMLHADSVEEAVLHYGKLAFDAGLDGVVCSAQEASKIKSVTSERFLTVTPGIRMKGSLTHDQARIATPREAKRLGSDFIVVGRNITQAINPQDTYNQILSEWRDANEYPNRTPSA